MSKKELDKATFRFDRPSKPGFKTGPPLFVTNEMPANQLGESLCFDTKGEWTKELEKCAAKRVQSSHGIHYFAKWCLEGPDKGHLLNPFSIYFREGDDVKMEQRRGRLRYEFRQVTEAVFNNYINFLKTKLYKYCQAAEGEILDG
jgi:hypothetical protein